VKTKVSIRLAEPSDCAHLAEIYNSSLLRQALEYPPLTEKHFEDALQNTNTRIHIAEENEILGFSWIELKAAFARSHYLKLICIKPGVERLGIGGQLMTNVEELFLKPNGLFLLVSATNEGAKTFYKSRGYRKSGEIPDFVKKGLTEEIYFKPV
jgi:ribosomal protein S18 acetylase RimI-like enzyme